MAVHHAAPGEIVSVRPLGAALATSRTTTLIKTNRFEILHMVLPAGKEIHEHRAPAEIVVQGVEGEVAFSTMGKTLMLSAGDLAHLSAGEPHSVKATTDSSLLVTILAPAQK